MAPQVVRLQLPRGMSLAQARRAVQRVNVQASADLDAYYYPDGAAADCIGPNCEAARLVGWAQPQVGRCGAAMPLVGLIDTAIDVDHEALKGQAIEILDRPGSRSDKSSRDHGTAIAALLVGRAGSRTPGLIPQARVLAVDAFHKERGVADRADVVSLVAAIEALADREVRIINLSLSGPRNEVLKRAVEAARAKGIVLVAAAGNGGAGAEPSYPAAYPGVIAVTAVDRKLNIYRRATRGPYIDLAAPGVEILAAGSAAPGAPKSGTSYAVPFVSAAAALALASHPGMTIEDLQAKLERAAQDLGAPGRDATFGYGLVQMAGLCAPPADPPAVATFYEKPGDTWLRTQLKAEP
ncbi:S8 family serine peptidase [Microvirga lenta]|uniref:S8 family serine peptidase n=1 Tax=Microvirga lenta TaxID=2881337 RepID=UPI00299E3168|nr:S8 family serine peptidase [Microvirga lenta]